MKSNKIAETDMLHFSNKIQVVSVLIVVLVLNTGPVGAKQADLVLSLNPTGVELQTGVDGKAIFICKDVQWLNQTGEPQIPWQVMNILLPPDVVLQTVDIQLKDARFEDVEGLWDVAPAPPLVTTPHTQRQKKVFWPEDKTIVDGHDVDIYQKDAVWPDIEIRLVATGRLRKWRLAQIAIPLVKYNPVRRTLKRLVGGSLEVYFGRVSLAMTDAAIRDEMLDRIGEKAVRRIAVNFEKQRGAYTEAMKISKAMVGEVGEAAILSGEGANPGYVIITTSEIQAASQELNNFVAHKQSKGFDVQVITETDFGGGTGDTASENLRTWLQAHYITDNIQYVLLVGNPHPYQGDVPMKMLYPRNNAGDEYRESPSDYYYADLTGNWDLDGDGYYGEWDHDFGTGGVDRNWDVLVGRIPWYPEPNTTDAQVLYDSGPPHKGLYDGTPSYLGFMSGNTEPGREQRWSAHPFTMPDGNWVITQIDVDYHISNGRDFDLLNYVIWERTGQDRPEPGDEVIQGTVAAPLHYDDPRIDGPDDYLHHIDVKFSLEGGDYYLTIYAERSDETQGGAANWLGNTEDGIPLLDPNTNPNPGVRAFFWRSAQFPNPGFQEYNLAKSHWDSMVGQDPNQLYTAAFTIYGNPNDINVSASSQTQVLAGESIDVNDLDHILLKIMDYENTPQSESVWRQSILLPMKSDGYASDLNYFLGEEIKETVIVPKTGWSYYRIYDEDYGLDPPPEQIPCSKDNVINSWNSSPFGVVAWSTHGSPTSASFVMDTSLAETLNDSYPAFTFQSSCLTAHPETADNLAYSLLKNGAICTVGATRVAWIYVWQTSFAGIDSADSMAIEYITRLVQDEMDSGHSLYELKQALVPASAMTWMNYPDFCIYGCPAVGLYSYEPDGMTVSPHCGLSSEGEPGGPFVPNCQIYTVTNESNQSLEYVVEKTQVWTSLNGGDGPLTGTLEPNEATDIVVSINSNAEGLYAGQYSDSVEFTNLTNSVGNINRRVSLRPQILYGGTNTGSRVKTVTVDRTGNVFAAGLHLGDGHLVKIKPDGTEVWHYVFAGAVYPEGLAVDASGNVFMTGGFSGTVDFDPTDGNDWHATADWHHKIFITRINQDGTYGWTHSIGKDYYYSEGKAVACDYFGNVILTGSFRGTVDFDPSEGEDWHSSYGTTSCDIFVTKFGPDGSYLWSRTIGGNSTEVGEGIAVDPFADIVLAGRFMGTVDFDPTSGIDSHSSKGKYDVFVTELHADGSYGWTRTFGGGGDEIGWDVAVDHNGNIFTAGFFDDYRESTPYSVDFDPTSGIDLHICHGGRDVFLTKLIPDGNYSWTRTIGSLNNVQSESAEAVTVDGAGNPLIVGRFGSSIKVDFDPTPGTDWRLGGDVFVTRLGADGSYGWTAAMSGNDDFEAYDVAVDYKGNVFIGGEFKGTADFDPTEGEDLHSAGGSYLGFVTKLKRGAVPVIIADTDHDGDVDLMDFATFSSNWLFTDCENLNWCNWTDFNRSTKVDLVDLAILVNYWLAPIW